MKKFVAMSIVFVIMAAIGTGVLMLTGRFGWSEAIIAGASVSLAGIFGPIVAAWVQKMWQGRRA